VEIIVVVVDEYYYRNRYSTAAVEEMGARDDGDI
jgi:hypothetical protein